MKWTKQEEGVRERESEKANNDKYIPRMEKTEIGGGVTHRQREREGEREIEER